MYFKILHPLRYIFIEELKNEDTTAHKTQHSVGQVIGIKKASQK